MALIGMAFLWTGSQIPVYLLGGIPPLIYSDIGGVDRWIWFVLANLLTLAAICPFVGSLSDLMGRRYVAILGSVFLVIGMIVCGTTKTMGQFIGEYLIFALNYDLLIGESWNVHLRLRCWNLRTHLTRCNQ